MIDLAQILAAAAQRPSLEDIYGSCRMEPCACRRMSWLGRQCPNWTPMGVVDIADLHQWHRAASTKGRPPYTTTSSQKEEGNAHR